MAKRVLSISRIRSAVSMVIRIGRPSDDITGKSPAGSTGRLKRERPACTCQPRIVAGVAQETSAPSGSLRTIS
jgi:hypothetical protein